MNAFVSFTAKLIAAIAILIIATFSGCSIGGSITEYLGSRAGVRWELLESPLEKVVRILAADVDFVYVESVTGKIYYCDVVSQRDCWLEKPPSYVGTRSLVYRSGTPIPNLPSKTIDTAEVEYGGANVTRIAKYAVSENGEVWVWKYDPLEIPALDGSIKGSLIGFTVGAIISIFIWLHQNKSQDPNT